VDGGDILLAVAERLGLVVERRGGVPN